MKIKKKIALIAHDAKKDEMVSWAKYNKEALLNFEIYATGTTGKKINDFTDVEVNLLKSGPQGGDFECGAMIVNGELDALFFFIDPNSAHAHDVDIKALLRISMVYNLPVGCNRKSSDMIFTQLCLDN